MNPFYSRYVFIDESGDPNLNINKQGVSDYFVLTAVIVQSEILESVAEQAAGIIKLHFQSGEMKSSGVGNNQQRRFKILSDISQLQFKHYTLVIDKSEIFTESGLKFKKSFVKFIHRTLYQQLFEAYSSLSVIADEHGTSEFMQGFGLYIKNKFSPNLFESSAFKFGDSKDYPLIQISDFIAGTVSRIYSGKDPVKVFEPIRKRTIIIDEWPPKSPDIEVGLVDKDEYKFDVMVRRQAVNQAKIFIDKHTAIDDDSIKVQIATVRYLLYHYRSINPEEYLTTSHLHHHLSELGYDMSIRKLRAKVIGKLRDQSVFIVSSSKGLKIPFSLKDILVFSKQVNERVLPYLSRLQIIRKHFLLASDGDLDIVDKNSFPRLNNILKHQESLSDN